MSSSLRGSSRITQRAGYLLLSGAFVACNFPSYAFQRLDLGTGGGTGAGGISDAQAGGAGIGGTLAGGAGGGGAPGFAGGGASGFGGGGAAGPSGGGGGAAGAAGNGSGTLLFSDDFETGQASRWTADGTSDWSVIGTSPNKTYRQNTKGDALRSSSAGDLAWTDQALEARVKILTFGGSSTSDAVLLAARFRDVDNFYYAALRADGKVVLKARLNGTDSSLDASVSAGITTNTWYTVRLVAAGTQLTVYVDDAMIETVTGVLISSGSIALGTNNATAEFDDVSVALP